ncbi:MAG: hypothetical protein ACK50G_00605 [bacterium]|jgi:hypothetical protein
MKTPVIPQTYAQWHHCITVECGITLTRSFAEERLAIWSNPGADETRRFEQLYGQDHLARVRQWFAQALEQTPQQA